MEDRVSACSACSACGATLDGDTTACFHCGHVTRSAPLTKGQVVADRYELIGVLGRGGMGTVYEAHDRSLDERVALKVLSETAQGSTDADRRFRAEIKLARKIRHANVCAIHEYGHLQDVQYIVMELVSGQDLKKHLRGVGKLSPKEALNFAHQIGEGLQAIHEANVIHRDLKLSNVMLDDLGRIRLMDFGIAKGMGDTLGTVTGQILGTPEYMSPEQILGQPIDGRADIYALGIMTYEMLTGRVPFKADTPLATVMLQINEPPNLSDPAIPPEIARILRTALAKDPEERFRSAREYVAAVDAASRSLESSSLVAPSDRPPRASEARDQVTARRARVSQETVRSAQVAIGQPQKRRNGGAAPWGPIVAVSGVVLLAAGVAFWLVGESVDTPPRPAAPAQIQETAPTIEPARALDSPGVLPQYSKAPPPRTSSPRATDEPARKGESPPAKGASPTAPRTPTSRPAVQDDGPSPTTQPTPAPVTPSTTPRIVIPSPKPMATAILTEIPSPTPTPLVAPAVANPVGPVPAAAEIAAASPEPMGYLQLGASPYAHVTIDGKDAGTLPFKPLQLSSGRHLVRLVHPNYRPLQRTVTIRPGETAKLFVDWRLDGVAN